MSSQVQITVNGKPARVATGSVIAAALAQVGLSAFRYSPGGQPRGPLCGMGVCMECRVTVNGQKHVRSCTTVCAEGMDVRTDE